MYQAQVRKLEKNPKDKIQVLNSEKKLKELGFVDFVNNLSKAERIMIESNCHKYFIPWRDVWNKKPGENTRENVTTTTDELKLVLNKGGLL